MEEETGEENEAEIVVAEKKKTTTSANADDNKDGRRRLIPQSENFFQQNARAFHPPPYTLDEEISYAWATQPFSPRRGVDAVFECWMQCENENCSKWRRIPRIVGKVLE
jgi:hypothetical protein